MNDDYIIMLNGNGKEVKVPVGVYDNLEHIKHLIQSFPELSEEIESGTYGD